MDIPLKKLKHEEVPVRFLHDHHLYNQAIILSHIRHQQQWMSPNSPKHIIPPFVSSNAQSIPYTQEPPVLQNPERVVRHTECERFERSYQPNVALAPRQTVLAREREKEDGRDNCATVIKSEMQIKQERPSTPINDSSPPNIRNNSPETTTTNGGSMTAATAAPISPEGQSGSNEITSSTSPVPASMIPNIKQDSVSPHSSPSLTSPPPRSHLIHKSPPVVVTLITNQPAMNGIKKKVPLGNNPEFETSQDMDEDSLTGEPDSSNLNGIHAQQQTYYEIVSLLLKNNSTDDHIKILNIFKHMERELALVKDMHKKELVELQAKNMLSEEELRRKIDNLQHQISQQRMNGNAPSIIATSCLSSSSSSSSSISSNSSYEYDRNERRNSIVEKPNVIIKPLKKSWRITPCDDPPNKPLTTTTPTANITITTSTPPTIVMMPKSEDIINNNNTKIYNNNNNNSSNTSPINGSTDSASLDDAIKKTTTTGSNVVAIAPVIKSEKL